VRATPIPGPLGRPRQQPIGILVARTGKVLDRAFDDALAAVGGTRPTWLVLLAVKAGSGHTQSGIAERVGISGPTVTHHLDHLEAAKLVVRTRDPGNRRLQSISLTTDGDALFLRLRDAAVAFDRRLQAGVSDTEITELRRLLTALQDNVSATRPTTSTRAVPTREQSSP
jgi:MarR family transcriptional regulator, transcriptional regulator for hemolysin